MKYDISKSDYKAYLNSLIKETFKILPLYEEKIQSLSEENICLYEEKGQHLNSFIRSLLFEVNGAKKVLINFDGALLVKLLNVLTELQVEITNDDNHAFVRKTVLTTTREMSDYLKALDKEG
jgi:hypothetical protein